jgi:hypothetical protein
MQAKQSNQAIKQEEGGAALVRKWENFLCRIESASVCQWGNWLSFELADSSLQSLVQCWAGTRVWSIRTAGSVPVPVSRNRTGTGSEFWNQF